MNFALDPVPHAEAVRMITDKPALVRDQFDLLPEELKARAFTITGIEDFDIMQGVRDEIAKLPAGADWKKTKREVAAKLSPWFTAAGAESRAELLLSHHAFTAYASTQARIMDAQADVFPYRQYLSTGDHKVRASHRALDGIILRADHRFWHDHTPPWEFRCRCQVVELLDDEAAAERAKDQDRPPEHRRVLEGDALRRLEAGHITRGPDIDVRLGTPLQSVRDTTLPYEQIAARWDPTTREAFESWADRQPLDGGRTLLQQLSGSEATARPRAPRAPRPATIAAALDAAGLTGKESWTRSDLAKLRSSLRVADPLPAGRKIKSIAGARQTGALAEREIRRTVQDLFDILPREIAESLPRLDIKVIRRFTKGLAGNARILGDFRSARAGGARIRLSVDALKGLKGEARRREMRSILSHELMHWLHLDATHQAARGYRSAIASHYLARTAGDPLEHKHGIPHRRDRWHWWYSGADVQGTRDGREIPTTYYELWETPELLTRNSALTHPDAAAFRETFALVHSIFDQP